MRSLILTILYLIKDTLHRWMSNLASPVARLLVVFFLSMCALFFLGSYVISTKIIREQIREQGADSISMIMNSAGGIQFPTERKMRELLQVDSYALRAVAYARDTQLNGVPVYSYDFNRTTQIYPLLAGGRATLFCEASAGLKPGLRSVQIGSENVTVYVKILDEQHPLIRLCRGHGIIVPPEVLKNFAPRALDTAGLHVLLKLKSEDVQIEDLMKLDSFLRTFSKLEDKQVVIVSAIALLKNMDILLGNQGQTRAIFCIGIAAIVGILLTSLASMEFRQNEYVYTLLKSFGIHPLLLIICFIGENLILVAGAFAGAVYAFMHAQKVLLTQFSQHRNHIIQMEEILPEVELIGIALCVCVLMSAIPITVAAYKEIGRVLK